MATRRAKQDLRGKVTLRMRGGAPSPLILKVAEHVARSFRGELHGVFLEHEELLAVAAMPFAREISLNGRRTRTLSPEAVRKEMEAASTAMARKFASLAKSASIPAHFKVIRGATLDALGDAMENTGILAIGEPLALPAPDIFPDLLSDLANFTGVVVVGCEACRIDGSILAVIDPAADVANVVDTAEQLAAERGEEVILLITGAEGDASERLETKARAALDPVTRYRFERSIVDTPQAFGSLVKDCETGLVVGRIGGPIAEDGMQAVRFACAIECPLLLLR